MTKDEHLAKWAANEWGSARARLMHMLVDMIARAPVSSLLRMADDRSVILNSNTPPRKRK